MLLAGAFPVAAVPHQLPPSSTKARACSRRPASSIGWPVSVRSSATGELKLPDSCISEPHQLRSMAEDGRLYKELFKIRYHEARPNGTVTVQTIANFFQEVACNHFLTKYSTRDGFGTTPMMGKLGLIFVISRMHMEVSRYPAWNDIVEIESWFHLHGTSHAERSWIIRDYVSGTVIARATSKWLVINQHTRRLQKLPEVLHDEVISHCMNTPRSAFLDGDNRISKKIEKLEEPALYFKRGIKPRRTDLDMNQHVNNTTYLTWLLESIPGNISESHELQCLTLDYKRECLHSDVIDSVTSPEPSGRGKSGAEHHLRGTGDGHSTPVHGDEEGLLRFLHVLKAPGKDGPEKNRGRTVWRKKQHSSLS